ncbi:MAG TPA: molybdenum cofactor guanylyltransferase, partial [Desulfuromonadaceae bacterium]
GLEPLHAVYSRRCLPKMETMLKNGERRILSFFELARIRLVPRGKIAGLDPDFASFRNINTPEEYGRLAEPD